MKKILWGLGVVVAIGLLLFVSLRDRVNTMLEEAVALPNATSSLVTDSQISPPVASSSSPSQRQMVNEVIRLQNGKTLKFSLPKGNHLTVAGQGYKRLRLMALSPDHRLFVGEMESAADTANGKLIVFEGLNKASGTFASSTVFLSHLRNPNSLTFYTDPEGRVWLYVALTDRLLRYPYHEGDHIPAGEPETIATFPTYARPWTQGGGHITRTVLAYKDKIYVSVGSSCNSCEEKLDEPSRASIMRMDPDGTHVEMVANGLRNALGMRIIYNQLFVTTHAVDHLGTERPEDLFLKVSDGKNYGWPYCYQYQKHVYADTSQVWNRAVDCKAVPLAEHGFPAHSAVMSFDLIQDQFLVALHGSGDKKLGRGYKLVTLDPKDYSEQDFLTGFLDNGTVLGRPVDVLRNDANSFFVTDDLNGAVYFVQSEGLTR